MRLPAMPGAADSAATHTAGGDGRSNHAGTDAALAGGSCKNCNYQKPAGNHSRLNGRTRDKARQTHITNWCWSFVPDSTPIIHERFCCNRGFATTTSLSAGVLAAQSLDVLFQVRLGPSRLCVPVSLRDSSISRRTVMNNAG